MKPTYDQVLAEAGGDPYLALAILIDCYDTSRRMISAGYARANTSHIEWQPKRPPADDSTSDEWVHTARSGTDD